MTPYPGAIGVFVEVPSRNNEELLSVLMNVKEDFLRGRKVSEFVVAYDINSSLNFVYNLETAGVSAVVVYDQASKILLRVDN